MTAKKKIVRKPGKKKSAAKAKPKRAAGKKSPPPARKRPAKKKPARPAAKRVPRRLAGRVAAPLRHPKPARAARPPTPLPAPTVVPPRPIPPEPPPTYSYDRAAALEALARVIQAFDKRDWRTCHRAATALPRLYPDFIEGVHKAQHLAVICRRLLGRPEKPKTVEDFELAATEHLNQGDGEGALALLSAGLKRHPRHGSLLYLKSCALVQLNRPDEAITTLDQAIDADSQNRIYAINGKDFAPLRLNPAFLALIRS